MHSSAWSYGPTLTQAHQSDTTDAWCSFNGKLACQTLGQSISRAHDQWTDGVDLLERRHSAEPAIGWCICDTQLLGNVQMCLTQWQLGPQERGLAEKVLAPFQIPWCCNPRLLFLARSVNILRSSKWPRSRLAAQMNSIS